jgi:hypothetical protein
MRNVPKDLLFRFPLSFGQLMVGNAPSIRAPDDRIHFPLLPSHEMCELFSLPQGRMRLLIKQLGALIENRKRVNTSESPKLYSSMPLTSRATQTPSAAAELNSASEWLYGPEEENPPAERKIRRV